MREFESVVPFADLADEGTGLIELEQARVGAARENVEMSFGVGRHAHRFAEIQARRHLDEVRHAVVRDLGYVLRFGFCLRREARRA